MSSVHEDGEATSYWDMNLPQLNLHSLSMCKSPHQHDCLASGFNSCPGSLGSFSVHWTAQADLWLVTRCICQLQLFFPAHELISLCHLCNWAGCYCCWFVIQNFFVWYRSEQFADEGECSHPHLTDGKTAMKTNFWEAAELRVSHWE